MNIIILLLRLKQIAINGFILFTIGGLLLKIFVAFSHNIFGSIVSQMLESQCQMIHAERTLSEMLSGTCIVHDHLGAFTGARIKSCCMS